VMIRNVTSFLLLFALCGGLVSCATSNEDVAYSLRGEASWYGEKYHGRKTASGEKYNMHKYTAAHKTLPFGTYVLVENVQTGQKVKVRINDRGPFIEGRIIDVSYKAAKELGLIDSGVAEVKVNVLRAPAQVTPLRKSRFYH
jgi:rare lipoprotein A